MLSFRVLIIDDDADDRELLREVLQRDGIEPILALESANEVLTFLQTIEKDEDLPHLIVTDLNMQGMTGLELLQSLKSTDRYRHITVVIYSTSSYSRDVQRCLLAGANEYITKPSNYAGLRNVSATLAQNHLPALYATFTGR
jgi:CheY-like chemotaxis protein